MRVFCESILCNFNNNGECTRDIVGLEHKMTGGGLVLMCVNDTDN